MTCPLSYRSCSLLLLVSSLTFAGCDEASHRAKEDPASEGPVVVAPGEDLQAALDRAANATVDRRLILLPGVHQSARTRFSLLALTKKHDGVVVEGETGAVLSAGSPNNPNRTTVSHVVYCGHGLTSETKLRNLTIRDAKGLLTSAGIPQEDFGSESATLKQGLFFQLDGGALKIFGNSYPVFDNILFEENSTKLCGGAVSVEHQGVCSSAVEFRNCRFIGNRCPATGSAVDVLQGSSVRLKNCLFVDNVGNYGMEEVQLRFGLTYNEEHGSGALTVFPGSKAEVIRCTFLNNWNGVDDHGIGSRYDGCLFINNGSTDGTRPGHTYEMDVVESDVVHNCVFHAEHPDLRGTISRDLNSFVAAEPSLNAAFAPTEDEYREVGYRPLP